MKHIFDKIALSFAAAALSLTACSTDAELTEPNAPEDETRTLVLAVAGDNDSRTYISKEEDGAAHPYRIRWSESEEPIKIIFRYNKTFQNSKLVNGTQKEGTYDAAANTTEFSADVRTDAYELWAVHPASVCASTNLSTSGGVNVKVAVPNVQTPAADSYDPAADMLITTTTYDIASSDIITLNFVRPVAIAHMMLRGLAAGDKLDKITFTAPEGTAICGQGVGYIGKGEVDFAASSVASTHKNAIKLDMSNYSAVDGTDLPVWFTTMPASLTGMHIKITATGADGKECVYEKNVTMTTPGNLTANTVSHFGIDLTGCRKEVVLQPIPAKAFVRLTPETEIKSGLEFVLVNENGGAPLIMNTTFKANELELTAGLNAVGDKEYYVSEADADNAQILKLYELSTDELRQGYTVQLFGTEKYLKASTGSSFGSYAMGAAGKFDCVIWNIDASGTISEFNTYNYTAAATPRYSYYNGSQFTNNAAAQVKEGQGVQIYCRAAESSVVVIDPYTGGNPDAVDAAAVGDFQPLTAGTQLQEGNQIVLLGQNWDGNAGTFQNYVLMTSTPDDYFTNYMTGAIVSTTYNEVPASITEEQTTTLTPTPLILQLVDNGDGTFSLKDIATGKFMNSESIGNRKTSFDAERKTAWTIYPDQCATYNDSQTTETQLTFKNLFEDSEKGYLTVDGGTFSGINKLFAPSFKFGIKIYYRGTTATTPAE